MRLLEPTYSKGNKLFYLFQSPRKLTRKEVEEKIYNEQVERSIRAALSLIEAILAVFRCRIEIEHDPEDMQGPIYSLDTTMAPTAIKQAPSAAPSPA